MVTTTPLLDEKGERLGSVHIAHDITQRKRAEAEILRHMEALERFNRASVGRELRMVELKKEINMLGSRLEEPPRYNLDFVDE